MYQSQLSHQNVIELPDHVKKAHRQPRGAYAPEPAARTALDILREKYKNNPSKWRRMVDRGRTVLHTGNSISWSRGGEADVAADDPAEPFMSGVSAYGKAPPNKPIIPTREGYVRGTPLASPSGNIGYISAPASSSSSSTHVKPKPKLSPRYNRDRPSSLVEGTTRQKVVLTPGFGKLSAGYGIGSSSHHRRVQPAPSAVDEDRPRYVERRVHPRDHEGKAWTYQQFLDFCHKNNKHDEKAAIKAAEKMWREALVHVSSDMPEDIIAL